MAQQTKQRHFRDRRKPEQLPRHYRDPRVNFPSTLADNVSGIGYTAKTHPKTRAAIHRVIDKQNRFSREA